MGTKTTVIYHSADYDGIFCREIARKFIKEQNLPEEQEVAYLGWNHGDAKIPVPEGKFFVLDLSPECLDWPDVTALPARMVWIDHHKTAMEQWPEHLAGWRMDGVAACRLVWQWFMIRDDLHGDLTLRPKEAFVERRVTEPLAVRLVGEYDIWDQRDPNAEVFQYGLDAQATDGSGEALDWATLLEFGSGSYVGTILNDGVAARRAIQKREADTIAGRSHTVQWAGFCFLALNTARCNSLSFRAGIEPQHDALMGYYWNGRKWTFSLYGVPGKPEVDLAALARMWGGGGHKQACGFQASWEEGRKFLGVPS